MNDGKISVRYARALYEAALEQHCEKEVYEALRNLSDNVADNLSQFDAVLKNPIIGNDDKIALLRTAVGTQVPQCLDNFINLVVGQGRESKMYLIALKYQEQYRTEKNILLTHVTTASELSEDALQRIKDYVARTFHAEVEAKVTINPALVGGYTLDIENKRLDASIAGRLNKLKEELKSNCK
ncbi:MAG: F0F1 ATP synthase subunit delta [Bacteroidales bacterium]|nr:F0F1 ATP synthase subunit delta [Bacteroidales bacterium]